MLHQTVLESLIELFFEIESQDELAKKATHINTLLSYNYENA